MKIPSSLLTTAASPPSFSYNSFGPPIKSKHGHPPQTRQNRLYHHRHLPSTWSWARCLGIRGRVNSNWPEPVWDRTRASLPSSSTGILCFWTLGHPKERTHLFFTTWLSHEFRQIHRLLDIQHPVFGSAYLLPKVTSLRERVLRTFWWSEWIF